MIMDFRVQPPYGGFLESHWFRPRPEVEDPVTGHPFHHGRWPMPSFDERSMDLFVQEMDEEGVQVAVVMGQRAAQPWGSVSNDDIGELCRLYPGRFVGFACIDPLEPEPAAETERCIRQVGCRGIHLLPGWSDPPKYDDDPVVYPVYETCRDLKVPIMITASQMIGPDLTYSFPAHIQKVATDFPDLTIIIGHASWPWTTQVCAVAYRCRNIYLMPEFYMYLPSWPGADHYVQAANSFLSHRMLFSSCYPARSVKQALHHFRQLSIRPEVQDLMLWHNGARILGLA